MATMTAQDLENVTRFLRFFRWVGVVVVVFGMVMGGRTLLFIGSAQSTTATVVSVRSERTGTGSDRTTSYYPTVRFTDHAGNEVTAESSVGSSAFNYRVGREVDIRFSPNNPQRFAIDTFMGLWAMTLLPLLIGGGFIGFSYLMPLFPAKVMTAQARASTTTTQSRDN